MNVDPHNQKKKVGHRQVGEHRSPTSRRLFNTYWLKLWNGSPPGAVLLSFAAVTGLLMAIPIVYVVWESLFAGADRWLRLLDTRIPQLLWNTLSLTVMVTLFAVAIGVSLAWLVNRTSLPGRKMWQWLLALPLVIPPYVGAVTYIIIFGPRGWLWRYWKQEEWLQQRFGDYPIDVYTFAGIFFVLTMFTYPYVYLIAGASLRKMNRNFEEVARAQGMTTGQVFWRVNLPFLRPAIGAGAILVALYVLSDFGAIAMMRYTTFTAAIYYQMGSYDNVSATVLSVVLILLTLIILWIEARTRKKQKYYQTTNSYHEPEILSLGKWKWPAFFFVAGVFTISVLLPVIVLVYWTVIGVGGGVLDAKFWGYAWNSLKVSGLAALFCMLLALPVVYLRSRYPSKVSHFIEKLSYAGYALPGVIVALGIIYLFNQYIPVLYNTFYLIAIAFVVRFLPQAMQSTDASLSLISPRIDEAARSLGQPPWKVMFTVIIPSILPGVLAGGALVFVSSIKELPATLLLRPPGFDTLAVRIWVETSEATYYTAAPAALLIVLVSALPLRYLLKKY
ncbi:iron ABC transporter permease [Halalkalibacterium halodurans]|uniref:ABC transporter permease n=1 Tax=Halalkalibacterium halodurans TaxID=86665 RepID=UPI002AA98205|nr:iron ABC transporter permease [Halalkalibacterium halodurans]MDY7221011.1 iron ABC transporter permease [Halalkalibacterium halodurans]MDY7240250.1 iron ABC transporter permease [Halalkalibacterium halodurans]MED4079901.1 iron ABC transporter permease [Halalkalibacterium halodurans]MED4085280.1 iron ABC transporter permease [Halalkalibacterium halodurans]MED4103813.1 iron ABC transporter permease [Halalkalibacterium halodurans]